MTDLDHAFMLACAALIFGAFGFRVARGWRRYAALLWCVPSFVALHYEALANIGPGRNPNIMLTGYWGGFACWSVMVVCVALIGYLWGCHDQYTLETQKRLAK